MMRICVAVFCSNSVNARGQSQIGEQNEVEYALAIYTVFGTIERKTPEHFSFLFLKLEKCTTAKSISNARILAFNRLHICLRIRNKNHARNK